MPTLYKVPRIGRVHCNTNIFSYSQIKLDYNGQIEPNGFVIKKIPTNYTNIINSGENVQLQHKVSFQTFTITITIMITPKTLFPVFLFKTHNLKNYSIKNAYLYT